MTSSLKEERMGQTGEPLLSESAHTLGASDKVVDLRTQQTAKENDKEPDKLVIALRWLLCQTINQHPNPERY
jgi:hypothetical protein